MLGGRGSVCLSLVLFCVLEGSGVRSASRDLWTVSAVHAARMGPVTPPWLRASWSDWFAVATP